MQFVQQLVEKLDKHGAAPHHLIIDNARIRYNSGLREWLEQRNKHKLKFLHPYSPFLNAVKECFSKLKNFVKKHPLDGEETLKERITAGSHGITKENCEDWVRHAIFFH